MFENETTRILNCYNESKKLINKLQKVMAPYEYGQPLKDAVFYECKVRVYSLSSLEHDAHYALENILKRYQLSRVPKNLRRSDDMTIKEHIKAINNITPDVFYYNAFYYDTYNKVYDNKRYKGIEFDTHKNIINIYNAYESSMYLFLDCINFLDSPEPITREQRNNISNALKNNNTFIFKGCKVTLYNNGRLVIAFSSRSTFTAFKNKADAMEKLVTKELKGV